MRSIKQLDLIGRTLVIENSGDRKALKICRLAGSGEKGVTYRVTDNFGEDLALKIVRKAQYSDYSLQAELARVRRLPPTFARMFSYGDIAQGLEDLKDSKEYYGIVEDWVDGISLADFLSSGTANIDVREFLLIVQTLCEALAALRGEGLVHNDLHGGNIMLSEVKSGPRQELTKVIRIIDCGAMMKTATKQTLIAQWQAELTSLERHAKGLPRCQELKRWLFWFSRNDTDYLTQHICDLLNVLLAHSVRLTIAERRFIDELEAVLQRMVDHDISRRLEDPAEIYGDIELQWKRVNSPEAPSMLTPFDYISAELIRNDLQLNDLFSEKCPWLETCATTDPLYIYGPRGCGKSTILRKLSLRSVLSRKDATECFDRQPFIGVYLSCSSELRSRFWLFKEDFFPEIHGDAIYFFSLLLIEALLEALEQLEDGRIQERIGRSVGLTPDTGYQIGQVILRRLNMAADAHRLQGSSWLGYLRKKIILERSAVWRRIVEAPAFRTPDPSIIFDICRGIEGVLPLLATKHIAFLIDDYSNQRIPTALQRMLNQTISFAKQGNPIFKVSSEFRGLDLDGIQEGREVNEVNLGREYVELKERDRTAFLEDILDKRFELSGMHVRVSDLLGRSDLSAGMPMARAIRDAFSSGKRSSSDSERFYYWGIDNISDVCSGDIATAIDLIKQIYIQVKDINPLPCPISRATQHEVIKRYSDREHVYLRYFAKDGQKISRIVDALCRLAHDAAVEAISRKDGKDEPMIKTHLDISDNAVAGLTENLRGVLEEMERKGVLFSLDTSRSRIANAGTERFQVRRILLVKHIAPLGRRDPIKLDHEQKIVHLLTEPEEFVKEELTGQRVIRFLNAHD